AARERARAAQAPSGGLSRQGPGASPQPAAAPAPAMPAPKASRSPAARADRIDGAVIDRALETDIGLQSGAPAQSPREMPASPMTDAHRAARHARRARAIRWLVLAVVLLVPLIALVLSLRASHRPDTRVSIAPDGGTHQ